MHQETRSMSAKPRCSVPGKLGNLLCMELKSSERESQDSTRIGRWIGPEGMMVQSSISWGPKPAEPAGVVGGCELQIRLGKIRLGSWRMHNLEWVFSGRLDQIRLHWDSRGLFVGLRRQIKLWVGVMRSVLPLRASWKRSGFRRVYYNWELLQKN